MLKWWQDLGRGPKWFLAGMLFVLALGAAGWLGYRKLQAERQAREIAEFQAHEQRTLLGTYEAKLAQLYRVTGSLAGLDSVAKILGGKVIGGVEFTVPGRDTVWVHDNVPTDLLDDSTRVAQVTDSGFTGLVHVTAIAPPWPAPLGITTHVTRPPFRPTVGFIELGDSVVVVVGWQGERVELGSAYHKPKQKLPPRAALLSAFTDGRYVHDQEIRVSGGANVTLRTWSVFGGVEQKIPFSGSMTNPAWFVGVQRSFRIF